MKLTITNGVAAICIPPEERTVFRDLILKIRSSESFEFPDDVPSIERVMFGVPNLLQSCETILEGLASLARVSNGKETLEASVSIPEAESLTYVFLGNVIDSDYFEHCTDQLISGLQSHHDPHGVYTTDEFITIFVDPRWGFVPMQDIHTSLFPK
jgi:hypothetical protein